MNHIIIGCFYMLYGLLSIQPMHAQSGYPPPCFDVKQVKIDTDQNKGQILADFIQNCVQNNYWINDKGIVLLREYNNEAGKPCWLLLPGIDDSYKDNPPDRFATFRGDIVLIFSADSNRNSKAAHGDKNTLNQCLAQIIGDRVYTRPNMRSRWTDNMMPFTNRKMKEGTRRIRGWKLSKAITPITLQQDSFRMALFPESEVRYK